MSERPNLNTKISVKDFKEFYWLKKELSDFCRSVQLPTTGSKQLLTNRIIAFLNGEEPTLVVHKNKPTSNFDWHKAKLTLSTVITDNYKNTENCRHFFEDQVGPQFKFNVQFMNWMKTAAGQSLEEAIDQWHRIKTQKRSNKEPKIIAPQFEYNTYIRDCLADNPGMSRSAAIEYWKLKKSRRGDNVYRKSDLKKPK